VCFPFDKAAVQDTYDFKGNFPKFIQLVGGTVFYINRYRRIEYK